MNILIFTKYQNSINLSAVESRIWKG